MKRSSLHLSSVSSNSIASTRTQPLTQQPQPQRHFAAAAKPAAAAGKPKPAGAPAAAADPNVKYPRTAMSVSLLPRWSPNEHLPEVVPRVLEFQKSGVRLLNKFGHKPLHPVHRLFRESKTIVFLLLQRSDPVMLQAETTLLRDAFGLKLTPISNLQARKAAQKYHFSYLTDVLCQGEMLFGFSTEAMPWLKLKTLSRTPFSSFFFVAATSDGVIYTPQRLALLNRATVASIHSDIVRCLTLPHQGVLQNLQSTYSVFTQIAHESTSFSKERGGAPKSDDKAEAKTAAPAAAADAKPAAAAAQ